MKINFEITYEVDNFVSIEEEIAKLNLDPKLKIKNYKINPKGVIYNYITEIPSKKIIEKIKSGATNHSVIMNQITYSARIAGIQYKSFARNRKCVSCGLIGDRFVLQTQSKVNDVDQLHFNLYGIENDEYVLMTIDHRIPTSMGGKNDLSNIETMCNNCNWIKDSTTLSYLQVNILKKIRDENINKMSKKDLCKLLIDMRNQMISDEITND